MPTVELNALAMKLGEPATYKIESQPAQLPQSVRNTSGFTMASRPRMTQPTMIGANQIIPTSHGYPSMHVPNFNRNGRYYNQSSRYAYPYKFANNGYREVLVFIYKIIPFIEHLLLIFIIYFRTYYLRTYFA